VVFLAEFTEHDLFACTSTPCSYSDATVKQILALNFDSIGAVSVEASKQQNHNLMSASHFKNLVKGHRFKRPRHHYDIGMQVVVNNTVMVFLSSIVL
jgi:hypothetical protein